MRNVRENPRNPRKGCVSVCRCFVFRPARVCPNPREPSQPSQKSRLLGGRGRSPIVWARRARLEKPSLSRWYGGARAGNPRGFGQGEGYRPPSAPDPGLRGQLYGRPLSTSVVVLIILDAAVFALDLLPRQHSLARNGLRSKSSPGPRSMYKFGRASTASYRSRRTSDAVSRRACMFRSPPPWPKTTSCRPCFQSSSRRRRPSARTSRAGSRRPSGGDARPSRGKRGQSGPRCRSSHELFSLLAFGVLRPIDQSRPISKMVANQITLCFQLFISILRPIDQFYGFV